MDLEREELRHRYRLCRVGFGLIALGLGLLFVDCGLHLALLLGGGGVHGIVGVLKSQWWVWLVGAPITWATVVGAYLLWGRSADPVWQRRAGLLVIMNGIDLLSWILQHSDDLGLHLGPLGNDWLRYQLSTGLGWAEFLLFATMAIDMLSQLGKDPATEINTGARSMATIGLVFWAIVFVAQTDWGKGLPLQPRPIPQQMGRDTWILIMFGSTLLTTLTSFQVAVLCGSAFLGCGRALQVMNHDDLAEDLLRSRSETFAEDPDRWFVQDDDPWR
jgi:hypothetical protein